MRTTKKQSREGEPSVDDMRYDLAEAEAMNISVSNIIDMLIYGCEPLEDVSDIEIRDEWEQLFANNNEDEMGVAK
jgi:hypothetical protein